LISIRTIEKSVVGEPGKVYSTAPEVAIGDDGKTYFIKGRNSPVAFSEVAGCRLAAIAGLNVPIAHVGFFGDAFYAAVESVPTPYRDIRPWLRDLQRIANESQLFETIAVDTWLVNDDRNMGNLVGSPLGGGRISLFMIDFEKSRALADSPFIGSGVVDPRRLWPTAELGSILRQIRPAQCPRGVIETIRSISVQQLQDSLLPIAADLPFVSWHESSIEFLARRARNIDSLVENVWATN
jgi:hypothetical protein